MCHVVVLQYVMARRLMLLSMCTACIDWLHGWKYLRLGTRCTLMLAVIHILQYPALFWMDMWPLLRSDVGFGLQFLAMPRQPDSGLICFQCHVWSACSDLRR